MIKCWKVRYTNLRYGWVYCFSNLPNFPKIFLTLDSVKLVLKTTSLSGDLGMDQVIELSEAED